VAVWALAGLIGSSLALPQASSGITTTTTTNATDETTSTTSTSTISTFASIETNITTTVITAYIHPAKVEPSLVIAITTRTITSYVPGPVTAYPALMTQTFISTDTIEVRETNSNGKSSTHMTWATFTGHSTKTIEDPNATTSEETPYYPFFSPTPECTLDPDATTTLDPDACPTDTATDTATDTTTESTETSTTAATTTSTTAHATPTATSTKT